MKELEKFPKIDLEMTSGSSRVKPGRAPSHHGPTHLTMGRTKLTHGGPRSVDAKGEEGGGENLGNLIFVPHWNLLSFQGFFIHLNRSLKPLC